MHKYWGFGLHILSAIEFPELLPADFATADVTINIGTTPHTLNGDDVEQNDYSSINKHEYLLSIDTVAKYYAANGNCIIAEPEPGIDEHSVRLYLLGGVMAAILYQRGQIPMHASAIVKNDKLILFTGHSGAGKSTLLAKLTGIGYTVFTDDVCVLTPSSNEVLGTASYPMMKLWEESIVQLGDDVYTRDFRIRPDIPKYGHFFYDKFITESYPVAKVFILAAQESAAAITVKKLTSIQAFVQLEKQAYRYQLIANKEVRQKQFELLSSLAAIAEVYEIIRPADATDVSLLVDALHNLL